MHAGARHFTDGVQVGHRGLSVPQVGSSDAVNSDAANHVVGCGHHGDGVATNGQSLCFQSASDGWEFFLEPLVEVAGDQVNMGCSVFFHLLINGSCNDVSRGQRTLRGVFECERECVRVRRWFPRLLCAGFGCLPCFNAALVQQDTAGPTDGL